MNKKCHNLWALGKLHNNFFCLNDPPDSYIYIVHWHNALKVKKSVLFEICVFEWLHYQFKGKNQCFLNLSKLHIFSSFSSLSNVSIVTEEKKNPLQFPNYLWHYTMAGYIQRQHTIRPNYLLHNVWFSRFILF